ncbi:nucleoporin NUP42 [Osmerus eperlanus]|uniref:nucleoporin NUP42 n=1 Tax=Osmerus eperlanus TaxID=29151 RepID=UPI002E10C843
MVVCNFFMQGRCRYGDKCWNEHPSGGNASSGGGGGGSRGGYNNSRPPSNRGGAGGGGFGNRVWVNPSQRSGGNYVQPSSFSRGGDDWGGGGGNNWNTGESGGGRDNVKSTEFSFSSQNRFTALNNASTFDKAGRDRPGDENEKHLETIQNDMEIWETSGQWVFSCYSVLKATISGFRDHSPEELRLEYYNNKDSGDLQGYANGIIQLINQWRSRVQELKTMNATTRVAMLAELNNPVPQATSEGFGSSGTGFGSSTTSFGAGGFGAPAQPQPSSASGFSFAVPSAEFGSSATQAAPTGFGIAAATAVATPPPSGFSSFPASSAPSASGFSFAAPVAEATKAPSTSGFGGSASGFSFSSTANSGGGFGAAAPSTGGNDFGQTSVSSLFGGSTTGTVAGTGSAGEVTDSLFTSQSELTPEELSEFGAKRFSLGQIPLKPPPANMLVI